MRSRKDILIKAVLSYDVPDDDVRLIVNELGVIDFNGEWIWDVKELSKLQESELDEMLDVLMKRYKEDA